MIPTCTAEKIKTLSPVGGRLSGILPRKEAECITGRTLFFTGASMQLPYFKFMVNDYLSGKIQACSFSTQGIFINLISMIWKDKGLLEVDKAMLCRILRTTETELDDAVNELEKYDIITIGKNGKMTVKFISEQMEELTEAHSRRSLAGMQGGRGNKKSNALKPESNALQSESEEEAETKKEKKPYGQYSSVKLTDEEHSKLVDKNGKDRLDCAIEVLDGYIASTGRKYKNHAAVLKDGSWVWEKVDKSMPTLRISMI